MLKGVSKASGCTPEILVKNAARVFLDSPEWQTLDIWVGSVVEENQWLSAIPHPSAVLTKPLQASVSPRAKQNSPHFTVNIKRNNVCQLRILRYSINALAFVLTLPSSSQETRWGTRLVKDKSRSCWPTSTESCALFRGCIVQSFQCARAV